MKYFLFYSNFSDDVDLEEYNDIKKVEDKIKRLLDRGVQKENIHIIKGEELIFNEAREKHINIINETKPSYTLYNRKRKSVLGFEDEKELKDFITNKINKEKYTIDDFEIKRQSSYKCEIVEYPKTVVIMEGE